MNSRHLYAAVGFVCGFVLVVYGFNWLSIGLPGARAFTSQFLGLNLLVGGSAFIFGSLYFLLKPSEPAAQPVSLEPVASRPDVGLEIVVEEEGQPRPGFYKKIEYVGYFFTFLGLISAVNLIYQVFVRSAYNEGLWWIEILLVTFGVLSYVIFGSVGKLGRREEAQLAAMAASLTEGATNESPHAATAVLQPGMPGGGLPPIELNPADFARNSAGDYEKRLAGEFYDMFHVDPDTVTVWREDRREMRTAYLAGPYELNKSMLEERVRTGQELTVGILSLTVDTMRNLLGLLEKSAAASVSAQREV